jgi:hypothetical protein
MTTSRRRWVSALMVLLSIAFSFGARGDDPPAPSHAATVEAEREAAARAFVHAHHPELESLLKRLQDRNPAEYRKAIGDLWSVSQRLADQKQRDPERHRLMLDAWKAGSRVRLLAARVQMSGPDRESQEADLREALDDQLDADTAVQSYELNQARQRVERLEAQLEKTARNREATVETRFRALTRKSGTAASVAGKTRSRPKTTAGPTKSSDPDQSPTKAPDDHPAPKKGVSP